MNWQKIKRQLRNSKRSWTIQFNSWSGPVTMGLAYAEQQIPALKPFMPDNIYMTALGVVVAVNILLRFKTDTPLEER